MSEDGKVANETFGFPCTCQHAVPMMVNQSIPKNTSKARSSSPTLMGRSPSVDVTDEILAQLAHPSWREIEQEWTRGLIGSRECLERQIALVDTSAEELHALIDAVPIDPAFSRFLPLHAPARHSALRAE